MFLEAVYRFFAGFLAFFMFLWFFQFLTVEREMLADIDIFGFLVVFDILDEFVVKTEPENDHFLSNMCKKMTSFFGFSGFRQIPRPWNPWFWTGFGPVQIRTIQNR